MARLREVPPNSETAKEFLKVYATTFGWGDLSEDTVMDLGCGRGLYCARTVLENFPKVKSIIALDGCLKELQGITFKSPSITKFYANILNRADIRPYEGKVNKVISTNVLHQIFDKEKVFKNVYRLLKPGGEAAFLFTMDLGTYHILEILRQSARFKDYFKGSYLHRLYSNQFKADNYRDMLEKIGFRIILIGEEKYYFSIDSFREYENGLLYYNVLDAFSVPPELGPVIKESASHIYRDEFYDQKSFYRKTVMSIFVTKPCESGTASCSF